MIDIGATYNYFASPEVERLRLVIEKGSGKVKTINLIAQPIVEVAKSVLIKIRFWPLLDMDKAFEVQTDASDFALGRVIMQKSHPMAYKSRKLNNAERRYSVHEKKLLAVVHCLIVWRHIYMDLISL
ncbi:RT RNaseH 2 domain-containing protein [Abeliophyllum distichum]|uniref:RT RNaseH 2 domain-containing protein n=1 Tax=Abeliophyllum distichum TaxID=126358 RepID=A0ABD1RTX6_9LAMI